MVGASQLQGRDVQEVLLDIFVWASAAKSKAAMWEQTSPNHAMQVQ